MFTWWKWFIWWKCDNVNLCKSNNLVSTFKTFDNLDKALICLPTLQHTKAMWLLKLRSTFIVIPKNFTYVTD